MTLILDPAWGLVGWAHFAPPLSDSFRKTYRQLLRWNDELPFARFAISEDERPMLTAEAASAGLDRDAVGGLLARLLAICDFVHADALAGMNELRRKQAALADTLPRPEGVALLERYADVVAELEPPPA